MWIINMKEYVLLICAKKGKICKSVLNKEKLKIISVSLGFPTLIF